MDGPHSVPDAHCSASMVVDNFHINSSRVSEHLKIRITGVLYIV